MKEVNYTSEEYWFDNPEHDSMDNYGEKYYANTIFKELISKLKLPDGYIVVLGANRGVSMNILIDTFGRDRVIGYDLHNPSKHPNIEVKDVMSLTQEMPIAFAHNDVGSYSTQPIEKHAAQMWAASNIVPGGFLLGRNNLNRASIKNEDILEGMGFKNYQFQDLQYFFDMSNLSKFEIEGHMLSRKKS